MSKIRLNFQFLIYNQTKLINLEFLFFCGIRGRARSLLLRPLWQVQRSGNGASGSKPRGSLWPVRQEIYLKDRPQHCHATRKSSLLVLILCVFVSMYSRWYFRNSTRRENETHIYSASAAFIVCHAQKTGLFHKDSFLTRRLNLSFACSNTRYLIMPNFDDALFIQLEIVTYRGDSCLGQHIKEKKLKKSTFTSFNNITTDNQRKLVYSMHLTINSLNLQWPIQSPCILCDAKFWAKKRK